MKVELKFICDSEAEAAELLASLDREPAAAGEPEKPKRTRKKTADTTQAQVADAPQSTAPSDPTGILGLPSTAPSPAASGLDSLLNLGNSAGQLPPAATTQPAPAAITPAPVQPAAITQQMVIAEFVKLGQQPGKGVDAVKQVLSVFNAPTMAGIKAEHYGHALRAVQAAYNAPTLGDVQAALKAAFGK